VESKSTITQETGTYWRQFRKLIIESIEHHATFLGLGCHINVTISSIHSKCDLIFLFSSLRLNLHQMMLEKCITYLRMRKCYVNLLKMKRMTLKIKYYTGKRWRYCWLEAFSSPQMNSCLNVLISISPIIS
jgi:hypothetical protein